MEQANKDEILRNSVGLMLSFGMSMLILGLVIDLIRGQNFGPATYFVTFVFVISVLVVVFHYKKLVLFMEELE